MNTDKLVFLFSLIFFLTSPLCAQEKVISFDSSYMHIATTLAAQDIDRAVLSADSLLKNSENGNQKMRSFLLLALLNEHKGALVDALFYAKQSEEIALKDKDYEWQVRAAGYLSTIFRRVDLIEESKVHIKIAEKANQKRKDEPNYNSIQSTIHHEKALHQMDMGRYAMGLEELQKSVDCLDKMPESAQKKWTLATLYETFSHCYLETNEYAKADEKLQLALELIGDQESEISGVIYHSLGKIELHNEHYDSALALFEKAEKFAEDHDQFILKSLVYGSLSNYYRAVKDHEKTVHYDALYSQISNDRAQSVKKISNELIIKLRSEKNEMGRSKSILLGVSLFLLVALALFLFLFQKTRKRDRLKYEEIIRKIQIDQPLVESQGVRLGQKLPEEQSPNALIMPIETEERLLKELQKMEEEEFFLQNDISLSTVAAQLQSNPKYISYIINTHKGKDFSNYVNELRVRFVIHKFQNDPEFLKYKFAFIADLCGFSSHSKFAAVFKSITDLSPSAFISQLKQEQKK